MLYEKLTEKQKKINERISLLLYMLKEGSLKEGTKEALLELFHKNAIDILNELGYEDSLNKKYNEYIQEIRSLNHENRELRKQLGMKVSNEDARERLKLICESFYEWWHNEGTGNIESITFNEYGMTATLRGYIHPFRHVRKTEEQVSMLKQKGFDVSSLVRYGQLLTASEKNFNMLKELFENAFPHSNIDKINTTTYLGSESKGEYIYVISEIIVNFNNLDDIKITEP